MCFNNLQVADILPANVIELWHTSDRKSGLWDDPRTFLNLSFLYLNCQCSMYCTLSGTRLGADQSRLLIPDNIRSTKTEHEKQRSNSPVAPSPWEGDRPGL